MTSSLEILDPNPSCEPGSLTVMLTATTRSRRIAQYLEGLSELMLKMVSDKDWENPDLIMHHADDMVAEHSFGPKVMMESRKEWIERLQHLAEKWPKTEHEVLAAKGHVDTTLRSAVVWTVFRTEGYPDFLNQTAVSQTFWRKMDDDVWRVVKKRTIRGGGSVDGLFDGSQGGDG